MNCQGYLQYVFCQIIRGVTVSTYGGLSGLYKLFLNVKTEMFIV